MRGIPLRVDDEFRELLKKIKIDRIKLGIDDKMKSDRRITKAIARLSYKDLNFYNTLLNSKLEDDTNKSGRRRYNG